jgi:tRNA (cmo5U34)-methyltransferase
MRELVTLLAGRFLEETEDRTVLDLGCSRGESLAPIVARFGARHRYVGVDVSGPMLESARERFKGLTDSGLVRIIEHDLRAGLPAGLPPVQVALSVLTAMFVPVELRSDLFSDVRERMRSSGALVIVEKVLGRTTQTRELFVEQYHAMKERNGYSREEIDRKALSLQGVLVPMTVAANEELLLGAGFRQVECVWRWMNFCAWLALP